MHQMSQGYDSGEKTPLEGIAYVSLQELATRISHRNTGRFTEDPIAEKLLARVAADENLHMIFYRDLTAAAYDVAPSAMTRAIAKEVLGFAMPGTGIRDFDRKAKRIAAAGIYDLRIHHDEVVQPLLRHWSFFEREGLDAEAEQAREQVAAFLEGIDALATRHDERRKR
jgi:acyl-[acyl-carrier-protein] desaturase